MYITEWVLVCVGTLKKVTTRIFLLLFRILKIFRTCCILHIWFLYLAQRTIYKLRKFSDLLQVPQFPQPIIFDWKIVVCYSLNHDSQVVSFLSGPSHQRPPVFVRLSIFQVPWGSKILLNCFPQQRPYLF